MMYTLTSPELCRFKLYHRSGAGRIAAFPAFPSEWKIQEVFWVNIHFCPASRIWRDIGFSAAR
jgi:hypothetical protein